MQAAVELLQAFEFVFEGEAFFGFFFVGVLHELGEAAEFFAEGVEQDAELFAVLFAETAAFFFKDLVGEVLEAAAEGVAGFVEQGEFFLLCLLFLFDAGGEVPVLHARVGQLFLQGGAVGFQTA